MTETVLNPAQAGYLDRFSRGIGKIITLVLALLLAAMVVAIAWQVLARYVLNAPSMYSEEFLRFSLVWLGFIAAGYAFATRSHLNLPLLIEMLPTRGQTFMAFFNALLTLTFGVVLVYGGWSSMTSSGGMMTPMLQIPTAVLQSVVAISGVMIAATQASYILSRLRAAPAIWPILVTAILVLAVIGSGIALLWQSAWMMNAVSDNLEVVSALVLFITFLIFLLMGSPIAIGLAFAGILTLGLQLDLASAFSTVGETMFNGLDSFGFLALPFFILAGNIMNATGLARRLIDFAMLVGGRIPGSLWQANVLANMLFGTLSGSGIAAATAIGGIINPVAREKNYDMAMTTAVNAASAPTGMLIPPSGALIVYSLITGGSASIIALFMAGYMPGLIMGGAVMFVAWRYARRHGYKPEVTSVALGDAMRVFLRAAPSLLLVVIVISGILGGAFTAIEGSGIAVVYSLVLALVYGGLNLSKLFDILVQTAIVSGIILFLISCSTMMSWSMTFASIPDTVGQLLTSISENKYVILLMINVVLLVVGVFMDMSPAMLIFTPIFYPVVTALGVDPVHFGVILVYNLSLGVVTPPVGTVLFVSCSISGEKIGDVLRPFLPIFALQLAGLIVVTFIPAVTMFIPRLFGL
ncbi:TRAP transporter large permease [Pseudooceanicola algae]|uniref:Uncharacterized protein n=1 Tax=Pseudooceanicola algae TaxID=1537215 RepID=A0A418SHB9_9RHOB|nr:TRAP transporter large permease subunit [Pseudooceanicola algae]QPM90450.1 hypothetical protein PSAL_016890 [Pseudooceanicola algae]